MLTFHGVIDTRAVYVDGIDTSTGYVDILHFYRHIMTICRWHQLAFHQHRHSRAGGNPAKTTLRAADKTLMLSCYAGIIYQLDSRLRGNDGRGYSQLPRESLMQQRLLQFVEGGELALVEGFEALGFFAECVEVV